VRARTGSGKTLAYCLPILHKILSNKNVGGVDGSMGDNEGNAGFVKALILVPTKELCVQVSKVLKSLTYYCDDIVSHATLVAGGNASASALAHQEAMLRDEPDVLVSTPGGLLAHIRSGGSVLESTLKLSVESLVVDEADLVLSFGYSDDVTEIMKYLPKICQGFLMSATLSPELNSLKKVVLHSPAVLKLEEEEEVDGGSKKDNKRNLTQFYLTLPKKDKNLVLYVFLKLGLLKGKGLFFTNTIDKGYRLKLFLEQFHIRSAVLNSELPLKSRLNIIEQFNVGNFDYLIATDESTDAASAGRRPGRNAQKDDDEVDSDDDNVEDEKNTEKDGKKSSKTTSKGKKNKKDTEYGVSRGLDFRGVSFVVNVDFPVTPESYTHRIGRTARGGARGVALSLVENDSIDNSVSLEAVQQSQPHLPLAASASSKDGNLRSTQPMSHDDGGEGTSQVAEVAMEYQLQPTPLDFDLNEIEGFRYRVEDVGRAVTKIAVRETRAAEIKAEILNSQRLQNYFESNASDLQILRHDRQATHISKVQDHLKNVPKYLLPRGMQVAATRKRKRRRIKNRSGTVQGQRRKDNDPLQSYEGAGMDLDGVEDVGGDDAAKDDGFNDPFEGDEDDTNDKKQKNNNVVLDTDHGHGRSTAGREAWKQRHGKGKYNRKYTKKQEESNRYGGSNRNGI